MDQPLRAASPAAPAVEVARKGGEISLGEKAAKARKGLGPSTSKTVATLPALTSFQRPQEQRSEGSPQVIEIEEGALEWLFSEEGAEDQESQRFLRKGQMWGIGGDPRDPRDQRLHGGAFTSIMKARKKPGIGR